MPAAKESKKRSLLYQDVDLSKPGQKIFFAVIIVLALLACAFVVDLGGQKSWNAAGAHYEPTIGHTQDGGQYAHLADSIIAGRASLDLPVSEALRAMENPYDTQTRLSLTEEGETIYWDYAFYEGNYYCYFGVLPCLITFVPYKLITGQDLPNDQAVLLFGWGVILAVFFILIQFQRTYFRKMSLFAFLLALVFFIASCGIWDQLFYARFYSVAISSSLFFALLGIGCWLKAKRQLDQSRSSVVWLVLGSLFVAFTLGCRPQLVLAALLALPIFWKNIKAGQFFSRSGAKNLLSVIAPFILVLIPICWYNFIRFDSPFDFGAAYNLTGADMTAYTFSIAKVAFRSLEYLFMPMIPTGEFPFFCAIDTAVNNGNIHWLFFTPEPFFAGCIFLSPACLLLFALFAPSARKKLKDRSVLGLSLMSLIVALAMIALASHVSGVNMRYFADFMWLFILSSIAVFWSLSNNGTNHAVCNVMLVLVLIGLILYAWTFLAKERIGSVWETHFDVLNGIAGFFK